MAIFKCKMCGGSLEITDNQSVATCEYCGTQQTLPKADDDVLANLFNRANNLRLKNEFDKSILNQILDTNEKVDINFKYFDVLELGWCLLPAVEDESAAQVRKGNFNLAFPLILLVSKGWTYCQSVDTLWARRCELHER